MTKLSLAAVEFINLPLPYHDLLGLITPSLGLITLGPDPYQRASTGLSGITRASIARSARLFHQNGHCPHDQPNRKTSAQPLCALYWLTRCDSAGAPVI